MKKTYIAMLSLGALLSSVTTAANAEVYKPTKISYYDYDNGWKPAEGSYSFEYEYKYDKAGNIIEQKYISANGDYILQTKTLDGYGMPIVIVEKQVADGNEKITKEERAYDPFLHDVAILRRSYNYKNGSWEFNKEYKTEITRNKDGNITEAISQQYDGLKKIVWAYGEEDTPVSYEQLRYKDGSGSNGEWEREYLYTNICWDKFDGHLAYYGDLFLHPANFKTETMRIAGFDDCGRDGKLWRRYRYEYDTDNPYDYIERVYDTDDILEFSGEYNDRDKEITYTFLDYGPDGKISDGYIIIQEFDDHYNSISYADYSLIIEDGRIVGKEIYSMKTYELTYDDKGNLLEYIQKLRAPGETETKPCRKGVYSDYVLINDAGVSVAAEDNATAGGTVYNIFGIPVGTVSNAAETDALPAGIYILNGRKHVTGASR